MFIKIWNGISTSVSRICAALGETGVAVTTAVMFIVLTALIVSAHGRSKADTWMSCFESAGCTGSVTDKSGGGGSGQGVAKISTVIGTGLQPEQTRVLVDRLNMQLRDVQRRGDYHLKVMRDYYVNYYLAVTMALFVGAVAAVLLFFISQKGWKDAAHWQTASFIVMTTAAAIFGTFPTLYSQEDNIEQNKELYLLHKTLETELFTFAATGEPTDRSKLGLQENDPVPTATFIRYVDRRMSELHKLPLGFDYTRLPVDYLAGTPLEAKPKEPQPPGADARKNGGKVNAVSTASQQGTR